MKNNLKDLSAKRCSKTNLNTQRCENKTHCGERLSRRLATTGLRQLKIPRFIRPGRNKDKPRLVVCIERKNFEKQQITTSIVTTFVSPQKLVLHTK